MYYLCILTSPSLHSGVAAVFQGRFSLARYNVLVVYCAAAGLVSAAKP